jgi:hypothetical protein
MPNDFWSEPDPERVALPAPKPGVNFSEYLRTDAGNARAFLDLFGETLRFIDGRWVARNGGLWVQLCELEILPLARRATEEMLKWAAAEPPCIRKAWEKHAVATQSAARLRAMIQLAMGESLARQRR